MMQITLTGNTHGIYVDPVTCNASINYKEASNIHDVELSGVNGLVIDRDKDGSFKIIQASGYDSERGIFVDLY